MPLEVELPSTEERDDLLDALARLCSAAGAVPLLTEPVMPTQR